MWRIPLYLVLVLAIHHAHVDVATKGLWGRLKRFRQGRTFGFTWPQAWAFSHGRLPAIAGGASLTETAHPANYILKELDESEASYCRDTVTVLSGQNLKAGAVVGALALGVGRASIPTVTGSSPGNGTMTAVSVGPDAQAGSYLLACTAIASNGGTFSVTAPDGTALPNATVAVAYVSSHINFLLNDGSSDFQLTARFAIVVSTTAPLVVGTGNGTISSLSLGAAAKLGTYVFKCIVAATDAATFELLDPDGRSLGEMALTTTGSTAIFVTPQINATVTDGTAEFAAGDLFNVAVFNLLVAKVAAWDPTAVTGAQRPLGVLYADVDASAGDLPGVITARATAVIGARLIWGASISAAQQTAGKKLLAAIGIVAR